MIQINLMQIHKNLATFEKNTTIAIVIKNKLVRNIKIMYRNYTTRRHLENLTAQQLDDVGISLTNANNEIAKQFWQ